MSGLVNNGINLAYPMDSTTFFNNFFTAPFAFSSNEHDALLSFFEKFTGDVGSAKILVSAIIYTGKQQKIDPMHILEQFKNLPAGELSKTLALFLNYYRYGTSLLGTSPGQQSNRYVTRCILF